MMRFHHSTRRGRNRLNPRGQYSNSLANNRVAGSYSASRWSQLNYCRETNIHFNRRLPVESPSSLAGEWSKLEETLGEFIEQNISVTGGKLHDFIKSSPTISATNSQLISSSANNTSLSTCCSSATRSQINKNQSTLKSFKFRPSIEDRLKRLSFSEKNENINKRKFNLLRNNNNNIKYDKIQNEKGQLSTENIKQVEASGTATATTTTTTTTTTTSSSSSSSSNETFNKLDMDSIRERLISQVQKHPFWSNKAAKRMHLTSIEERNIYIYELVSFCERRQLEWRYEPYRGGLVNSVPFARRQLIEQQLSVNGDSLAVTTSTPSSPLRGDIEHSNNSNGNGNNNNNSKQLTFKQQESFGNWSTCSSSQRLEVLAGDCKQKRDLLEATNKTDTRRVRLSHMERSSSAASAVVTSQQQQQQQQQHLQQHQKNCSTSLINGSQTSGSAQLLSLYEPIGAIQRPLPSPEHVWSIELSASSMPKIFTGYANTSELANSSFVKRCHGCQGKGRLKCKSCHGVGYEVCISCSGKGTMRNLSSSFRSSSGRDSSFSESYNSRSNGDTNYDVSDSSAFYSISQDNNSNSNSSSNKRYNDQGKASVSGNGSSAWLTEPCHFCHGAGQKRCWICAGKSYNHCPGCFGSGQLRCFLNLHVTFLNHRDEHFLNNSDNIIPKDRLRLCKGQILLDEIDSHLEPIQNIQLITTKSIGEQDKQTELDLLKSTSRKMLEKHYQTYRNERLIKQRHKLTLIECHIVGYEWRKRRGHFVIYGDDKRVYIAKYPFKTICNIT